MGEVINTRGEGGVRCVVCVLLSPPYPCPTPTPRCPQEKADHVGIVALIVGTPITQLLVSGGAGNRPVGGGHARSNNTPILHRQQQAHLCTLRLLSGVPSQAKDPSANLRVMGAAGVALVVAAYLEPLMRTLSFVGIGIIIFVR